MIFIDRNLSSPISSESFLFQRSRIRKLKTCHPFPAGIYLVKVNYRNTRKCEICSKLTIKTLERPQWRRSGAFIVNFEHILLLLCSGVSIINIEHVIAGWVVLLTEDIG